MDKRGEAAARPSEPDGPRDLAGRAAVRAAQATESVAGGHCHAQGLLRGRGDAVTTHGEADKAGAQSDLEHGPEGAHHHSDASEDHREGGEGGSVRYSEAQAERIYGAR